MLLDVNLRDNESKKNFIYMSGTSVGPSVVRALPLAAGINIGGHYKWHFFAFFLSFSLLLPAHC